MYEYLCRGFKVTDVADDLEQTKKRTLAQCGNGNIMYLNCTQTMGIIQFNTI